MVVRALLALLFLIGGFGVQAYAQEVYFIRRERAKGIIINFVGFVLILISLIILI